MTPLDDCGVPDTQHVSTAGCGLTLIFKDADLGHDTVGNEGKFQFIFSNMTIYYGSPHNKIMMKACTVHL